MKIFIINKNFIFFQKILLSNAINDNIPIKYPNNNNIIPKKSTLNSNQLKKKFMCILGNIKKNEYTE